LAKFLLPIQVAANLLGCLWMRLRCIKNKIL
jgi:hypothetical protein